MVPLTQTEKTDCVPLTTIKRYDCVPLTTLKRYDCVPITTIKRYDCVPPYDPKEEEGVQNFFILRIKGLISLSKYNIFKTKLGKSACFYPLFTPLQFGFAPMFPFNKVYLYIGTKHKYEIGG